MGMTFGRIGVLMGGLSSEREISLKSGKAVYEALSASGQEALALDITTDDPQENIRLLESLHLDCAFLALHGRFGEDGTVQALLEQLHIPYTSSGVEASKLTMDKSLFRRVLTQHQVPVPRYKVFTRTTYDGRINLAAVLGMPLVVKPATHGSSIGLSIVDMEAELPAALERAFEYDDKIIVDEYIKGRELTVGILGDAPLAVIEIVPKRRLFDYEAKYHVGLTEYLVPAPLDARVSAELKDLAYTVHRLLGCAGCTRLDMILRGDDDPVVLELNTIPGFTETSLLPRAAKCEGITFSQLCLRLVAIAYEKARQQPSPA